MLSMRVNVYLPIASMTTSALWVNVGMALSNVTLNFGFSPRCSRVHTPIGINKAVLNSLPRDRVKMTFAGRSIFTIKMNNQPHKALIFKGRWLLET